MACRFVIVVLMLQFSEVMPSSIVRDSYESSNSDYDNDYLPVPGTYVPSNCSTCVGREELRRRNLEVIKDQILSKLGLTTTPNMTGRKPPRIPPIHKLMDMYGMQGDEPANPGVFYDDEIDDFHARTEKIIVIAQPTTSKSLRGILKFKFSEKASQSDVRNAYLWLHLRPSSTMPSGPVWIEIYQVLRAVEGESPVSKRAKEIKVDLLHHGGWISVDVREIVSTWFRNPNTNHGIFVKTSDGNHLVITDEMDSSTTPTIEVNLKPGKPRHKRTIGLSCDENSEETRCCKFPLTVDFDELGWDWIIAPKRYEANFCAGECPLAFLQKFPHSHIVQQANPPGTSGLCCAPRKLSSITMLYFDNDFNIIYGLLPGMVVDRCGCS
ncbi:growth/differentiation factor 8-like isoform X2 [Artemia franciscana]|uniref:growth/differentiation factor 8-like isoform X2 n=1 Tax=Artemia franciscana TaxID=6661 RepID=UPI0032DAAD70